MDNWEVKVLQAVRDFEIATKDQQRAQEHVTQFTRARIVAVEALFDLGLTHREVAARIGVSSGRVSQWSRIINEARIKRESDA